MVPCLLHQPFGQSEACLGNRESSHCVTSLLSARRSASAEQTPDRLLAVRPGLLRLGRGSCGQAESITQKGST